MIVPAGHGPGVVRRVAGPEPVSDLEEAFIACRRTKYRFRSDYFLKPDSFDLADVHSLILKYGLSNRVEGIFVSDAYGMLPDPVIVYDLDVPIEALGCYLPRNKLLVNRGTAGSFMGNGSDGVILNLGVADIFFGIDSKGALINAGEAGMYFGSYDNDCFAISLSEPGSYLDRRKPFRHDEIEGAFREYLEDLARICSGPLERIYETYGDIPALRIRADIEALLEESR